MAKVVVLGGAGAVGSVVVKTLARTEHFSEIIAADLNLARVEAVVKATGADKARAIKVDALDPASMKATIAGADVVVNCIGPFYKFVRPVLDAVLAAKINYVDICDDVDVTLEILKLDDVARQAGVKALIGMGSSPGATNLLAAFASRNLLDETEAIDIFHAHGGEAIEGEGVIAHRFHCMSIPIPMFLDGELKYVEYFREDGIALRETFNFPVVGPTPLYPYPHPEQVTLPNYIKCRRVTNKGSVLPQEYYDLIKDMCRLGLASREEVTVKGQTVVPYDFSMAFILRERDRILQKLNFGSQRGCVSVIVTGKKGGEYRQYRFHLASSSQALGEGTGIPAAVGAILMLSGKVAGPGVLPPEGCVNPLDFLAVTPSVMKFDSVKEGGKSFGGVVVEQVDAAGKVTKLDIG
jgi:saccharopine dehydrogenase (NAD+, L-lysine forming)